MVEHEDGLDSLSFVEKKKNSEYIIAANIFSVEMKNFLQSAHVNLRIVLPPP